MRKQNPKNTYIWTLKTLTKNNQASQLEPLHPSYLYSNMLQIAIHICQALMSVFHFKCMDKLEARF